MDNSESVKEKVKKWFKLENYEFTNSLTPEGWLLNIMIRSAALGSGLEKEELNDILARPLFEALLKCTSRVTRSRFLERFDKILAKQNGFWNEIVLNTTAVPFKNWDYLYLEGAYAKSEKTQYIRQKLNNPNLDLKQLIYDEEEYFTQDFSIFKDTAVPHF